MKNPNNPTKDSKSERVIVHVRMRPFSEDELKKDNTTPIETFDTVNKVIVGKNFLNLYYSQKGRREEKF
jgi:hypothetical protein